MSENPFAVFTPEGLSAETVVSIFSTDMPGLGNIEEPGHAFVIGTRGSGKSILFRYLEPDCQSLISGKPLQELPFVSFYVSFRETESQVTELARLDENHGQIFFNEHLLVLSICAMITSRLIKNNIIETSPLSAESVILLDDLSNILDIELEENQRNLASVLTEFSIRLSKSYRKSIQYVKKQAFKAEAISYEGDLFGFDDLLLPYIDFLRSALCIPKSTPIHLLLDDADSLTLTQTKILNSWVARRLSTRCNLKVAAQVTAYQTMLTTYGSRIEAPHDYQEIDLSDMSSKSSEKAYRSRIAAIVQRRLQTVGITKAADKYFQEDHAQKIAIEKEAKRLTAVWNAGKGRGYRARDDVQRYARPNYIADLGGSRKSRSKYSYSGFEQLVHLSSGVTRFFLEAAADMYSQAYSEAPSANRRIDEITPRIQNDVIREHAARQMIVSIKDLEKDIERLDGTPKRAVQLNNLIRGLGEMFEVALGDKSRSERKFFSFALSEEPTKEIEDVLTLGVRYGYLFKGIIGRKEGIGRAQLFILSRRLAPLFNLDPMGFSQYQFMTNDKIDILINKPREARLSLRSGKNSGATIDQMTIDFFESATDD